MTHFEIFISAVFTIASTVIGVLLWSILRNQHNEIRENKLETEAVKKEHFKTKENHAQMLNSHSTELQKHALELEHSKELASRAEAEMKTLIVQHNEKFDTVIGLFAENIKRGKK